MNLNIFAFGRNCVPKFEDKTVDRNVFGRNGDSLGKFILLRYNQLFIFHTYFRFGNDNTFVPFCYLPFVASYLFVTYLLLLRTFFLLTFCCFVPFFYLSFVASYLFVTYLLWLRTFLLLTFCCFVPFC
jgi:hypothetical protein